MHGLTNIVFDIENTSLDMVVGGQIQRHDAHAAFFYFLDESLCKIRWMIDDSDYERVESIAFDPKDSNKMYSMVTIGNASYFFQIANNRHTDVPETTKVDIDASSIPYSHLSIHMTDTVGGLYWLNSG